LSRRVSLPSADDLFRPTGQPQEAPAELAERRVGESSAPPDPEPDGQPVPAASRAPSGRVRHDEKMTVYVTADELLDLEHTRLALRRRGLSVDRGRVVREAVAIALADFEANGDQSALVQRLSQA
jgi:hypothetical protein